MSSLRYWIWLAQLKHVSIKNKHALLEMMGSPEQVYFADENEYKKFGLLKSQEIDSLCKKQLDEARRIADICRQKDIHIVTLQDAQYPSRLKAIFDAPLLIYVKGQLPIIDEEAAVAVVGTRQATPYGRRITERLAFGIAKGGAMIVTGLAAGIDSAAAIGAMKAGGKVLGVLGCGIDVVYPTWNEQLYRDVELSGALISEYPPSTKAYGSNFPFRNRIISGCSLGVLVVEAPQKSGALITAARALEQGRDVFVVPGNIDAQSFRGSNELLKEGAIPVTDSFDILKEYEMLFPAKLATDNVSDALSRYDKINSKNAINVENLSDKVIDKRPSVEYKEYTETKEQISKLSIEEQALLGVMTSEPVDINDIPTLPEVPFSQMTEILTSLAVQGYITELPGGKYMLNT